jgi:hypothetical protein
MMRGTMLVAGYETRLLLRAGRWRWLPGLYFGGAFAAVAWAGLEHTRTPPGTRGVPMFGALVLFLLTFMLLAAPGLTAGSINGDRRRGTLAVVQVTRLAPAEIAAGKLVSAWLAGIAALAVTVPFAAWSMLAGGVGAGRAVGAYVVIALLSGVFCAVGEALSALVDRAIAAVLLSYLVIFALTFGTLAGFGLTPTVTSLGSSPHRPDRAWWLLAANPYVVTADAAPGAPAPPAVGPVLVRPQILIFGDGPCAIPGNAACAGRPSGGRTSGGPVQAWHVYRLPPGGPLFADATPAPPASPPDSLSAISNAARDARGAPSGGRQAPVWPYGLGFDVALGATALWCATARLRAPVRKLRPGARIA